MNPEKHNYKSLKPLTKHEHFYTEKGTSYDANVLQDSKPLIHVLAVGEWGWAQLVESICQFSHVPTFN
jgi:hypothetical protein